ncbi:hypothetical protein B0H11DRAFT_2264643, partial [Mycena galericulata]
MSTIEQLTNIEGSAGTKGAGKAKARHKRGKGGKRGKKSWVTGTKLAFFERRKKEWQDAVTEDSAGAFYSKVAKLFINKYGWLFDLATDLEEDEEDPDDDTAELVLVEEEEEALPDEEQEERWGYYTDLRTKIGQWYRYHYRKVSGAENFASLFDQGEGIAAKPPRAKRVLHVYSRHYYATHIKAAFEKEWAEVLERAAGASGVVEGAEGAEGGEEGAESAEEGGEEGEKEKKKKKPSRINTLNAVTKKCWDAETPAFREMVEGIQEHENRAALEKWEAQQARDDQERTAEDYDQALKHAAVTLQPFADAAAKRYGMAVSILMAGPVGAKGGAIEVRSVHSGKTRGAVQKTWPLADPEGFKTVVSTMLRFGILAYSQEQCDARAIAGDAMQGETHSATAVGGSGPAGSSTTPAPAAGGAMGAGASGTSASAAAVARGGAGAAAASKGKAVARKAGPKEKGVAKKAAPKEKSGAAAKAGELGTPLARSKPRPIPKKTAGGSKRAEEGARGGEHGGGREGDGDGDGNGGGVGDGGAAAGREGANAGEEGRSNGDGGQAPLQEEEEEEGVPREEEEEEVPAPAKWGARTQTRWPDELKKLYGAMEREGAASWGPEWESLTDALVAFEEACGFPFERVAMERKGRVSLIHRWMKTNRPYSFPLALREEESVELLAEEWWS